MTMSFTTCISQNWNGGLVLILFLPSFYYIYEYNIAEYAMALPFYFFNYPLEVEMVSLVDSILRDERPAVTQLIDDTFPVILDNDKMCKTEDGEDEIHFLLFVIKSSMENFERRQTIRRTWGQEYLIPYSSTKRIFIVGVQPGKIELQQKVAQEHQEYQDIVQPYFGDTYFNDSLKLMTGLRWATQNCKGARYIAYVNDDYFVSTYNLVSHLNTLHTAKYHELYIGHAMENGVPIRNKGSQFYISLEQYPYRYWPPYAASGCVILSPVVAERLYIAMHYTRYLPFDDIFLAIVSWKLKLQVQNNKHLNYKATEFNTIRYTETKLYFQIYQVLATVPKQLSFTLCPIFLLILDVSPS